MEPPREGGTKVYINGPGHLTKMAAMSICGKDLKNLLLQNQKSYDHEIWHVASGTLSSTKFFINGDPELTLTYLRQGQIGSPLLLNRKNCYKVI